MESVSLMCYARSWISKIRIDRKNISEIKRFENSKKMISLVIILLIVVVYFEASTAILGACESSVQIVHIKDIPTLEQEETDEKIKTEWPTNYNRLLNEIQEYL